MRHCSRPRRGITLVELLVVIAIVGILMALLLPAVQAARETARQTQCKNHLHQIALATELFHDTFKVYPPGRYMPRPGGPPEADCGGEETTWLVRIMPYLEQQAAEQQWDYARAYGDHPQQVRERTFSFYVCPTRRSLDEAVGMGIIASTADTRILPLPGPIGCPIPFPTQATILASGAVGDYGGNHGDLSPGSSGLPSDFYYGGNGTGVVISSRARCDGDTPVDWSDRIGHKDVNDGLSNTLLAGEMHVPLGKLGQAPEDAFIFNGDHVLNFSRVGGPQAPIVSDIRSADHRLMAWGSWHPGVCHFALADGSVRAIAATLDADVLGRLCHRSDGQVIPFE